ncbi:MAG: TRAP transporter small permease [Oscillospiraceae bacterium]
MIKKIDKVVHRATGVLFAVSFVGLIAIILLIAADVFMRKVMQSTVLGAYEICERMLMCIVFAGLAYTESEKGHIYITMLISKFNRKLRFIIFGLMQLCSTVIALYLAYASFLQTTISFRTSTVTTVLLIPLYPFYAFEAICMVVFGLALLWSAIKSFAAVGSSSLAEEIQSSWS